MAELKLHSRHDALTLLYNQLLQELVATEFNIIGLEKQQSMTMTIDPNLSRVLNESKSQVAKIQGGLSIVYELLQKEEDKKPRGEKN